MNSSTAHPAVPTRESSDSSIAPAWHTVVLLFLMFGFYLVGAHVHLPGIFGGHGRARRYLLIILFEWTTVSFIWWGLSLRGIRMRDLVGGSWARPVHFLRDLGLGMAFILTFTVLAHLLTAVSIRAMLPQTRFEMTLWALTSLTAGFCEEVIFRGYLQRQFSAFTHTVVAGIVLQSIVFGLSHRYQGGKFMSVIAIYGACFGLLAHWRRSLRPGMIGHALQDTAGPLIARHILTH